MEGRGVEKKKRSPLSRLCTTFSIGSIFFYSRSLGIPRDLISRNHRGSSGIPGNLISGDLWGSPEISRDLQSVSGESLEISGDLRGSLGMSSDP